MPEAQLPEPLDHAADDKGFKDFKEMFAAVEAAVEADVNAFFRLDLASHRFSVLECARSRSPVQRAVQGGQSEGTDSTPDPGATTDRRRLGMVPAPDYGVEGGRR